MKISGYSMLLSLYGCLMLSCSINKINLDEYKNKKLSVAEQKQDLHILKSALQEAHPGLYWYQTKETFENRIDSLSKTFKESTSINAYFKKVSPLASTIKCGHTRLITPSIELTKQQKKYYKDLGDTPVQQFSYYVNEDQKLYILKNNSADSALKKGDEIVRINNIPVKDLVVQLQKTYSSDGYNQTFYNRALEKSFAAYYTQFFGRQDSVVYSVKDANNLIKDHLIKNKKKLTDEAKKIEVADPSAKKEQLAKSKKEKKLNAYKGFDSEGKPLLNLTIDSVNNYRSAILTVKSFSFEKNDHSWFFKESFAEIKQKNVVNLIVDMRGNGGGNLSACYDLFRYLYIEPHRFTDRAVMNKKNFKSAKYFDKRIYYSFLYRWMQLRKDKNGYYSKLPTDKVRLAHTNVFKGNLYVLVNGFSFSATSLLAANLQGLKRGTFIGEETGGAYNQCSAGTLPLLTLPNSHLKLRLPLKIIGPVIKRPMQGRGVFPQVVVKTTLNDVFAGKDPVMEKAKEIINKQRNLSSL